MNILAQPSSKIIYPESDGKPMADNTLQFQYIVMIQGGLDAEFRDEPDVFVAGDHLWYPVEEQPEICQAPDVYVVFGRPKGHRSSYRQWEEDGIAPQVVFEIQSPSNRFGAMLRKFNFYQRYGVEEYYLFDPDRGTLEGWCRQGDQLVEIEQVQGWVSPRMGVRMASGNGELRLYGRNGQQFLTYLELAAQRDMESRRAEQEHQRAEQEHQRAEQEHQRAEQERQRAERLAERLRSLGIDPAE